MKSTLLVTVTTLVCLGSVITLPALADSQPIYSGNDSVTEAENASSTPTPNADFLIVEPRRLEVGHDADADTLNDVANQINQGIGGDSEEFLPDGMVVRGSSGSLQLGSEI